MDREREEAELGDSGGRAGPLEGVGLEVGGAHPGVGNGGVSRGCELEGGGWSELGGFRRVLVSELGGRYWARRRGQPTLLAPCWRNC